MNVDRQTQPWMLPAVVGVVLAVGCLLACRRHEPITKSAPSEAGAAVAPLPAEPLDARDRLLIQMALHRIARMENLCGGKPGGGRRIVLRPSSPAPHPWLTAFDQPKFGKWHVAYTMSDAIIVRNLEDRSTGRARITRFRQSDFDNMVIVGDEDLRNPKYLDEQKRYNYFRRDAAFKETYPDARYAVWMFLPGYDDAQRRALVKAVVGPSPPDAIVTCVLGQDRGRWRIEFFDQTCYP